MADREDPAGARRGPQQRIAFLGGPGHGLLEEHVHAAIEGGHADLGVQVVRQHDVDGVHVGPGEELAVVEMDGDVGEVVPCRLGGGLGAAGDRSEPSARRLRDGLGMVTAPGPVADQSESNHREIPKRAILLTL